MKGVTNLCAAMALAIAFMGASALQTAAQEKDTDTSGTWEGTWSWSAYSGGFALYLKQEGDTVKGTHDYEGRFIASLNEVPVMGTFKNSRLSLTVPSTAGYVEASVEGNTMTGTYLGPGNKLCNFTVTKVKPVRKK